ncbi:MAG: AsmA family protein, partial [Pseudomonadota bacterium]
MNAVIITLGTAIVLALVAALIGPMVVDWTAYRSTIEANAERLLGTEVDVRGDIEFRLLPSPRARLTDVRLGAAEQPILSAAAVELDVGLTPLLSRQLQVLDLRLESPVARIGINADGAVALPSLAIDNRIASYFDRSDVTVDSIAITGGRLDIVDRRTGRSSSVAGVDLTGNARSLRGPFSASGTAEIAGARTSLTVAGGALAEGVLPLSLRMTPAGADISFTFDGQLSGGFDAPALTGEAGIASAAAPTWSVRGALTADTEQVSLTRALVRYGVEPAQMELVLAATYALTLDEPVTLALEARQIDLDRLARSLGVTTQTDEGEPAAAAPRAITDALARHFAPLTALPQRAQSAQLPILAELDVGTIVVGGAIVRDASAGFAADARGVRLDRFEALFPGETGVTGSGRIADGFSGDLRISASQPAAFARWWSGEAFPGGAMAPAIVEGDFSIREGTFDAQRVSIRVGSTSADGRITYRNANPRPVLDIALSATQLDAADFVDVAALMSATGEGDVALPDILIDMSVAQMLVGDIAGSAVNLDGSFRDGTLTVDAFIADDIAGARVFASGTIGDLLGEPVGVIDGTLALDDGAQFAAALGTLMPAGPVAERVGRAVAAAAPAELTITVTGEPSAGSRNLAISVNGTLSGTNVDLVAAGSPGAQFLTAPASVLMEAENPDAGRLLSQLGLTVAASETAGALAADLSGTLGEGLEGSLRLEGLGAETAFEGRIATVDGRVLPEGALTLNVESLSGLSQALAVPLPPLGPVAISAEVSPRDGALQLQNVDATVAGERVTGVLAFGEDGLSGD